MNSTARRSLKWLFVFFILSSSAFAENPPTENKYLYKVTRVSDGDTFDATDGNIVFRVRIAGIDAPEKKQAFGQMATSRLKELILDKNIEIVRVGSGHDAFNRVLGQVVVDGKDIGIEMISQGLATYYRPGCVDYPLNKKKYDYDPRAYVDAETVARSGNINFWSGNTELPCQYRKENK